MKFTILVDPSLVMITLPYICLRRAPKKRFFLGNYQFYSSVVGFLEISNIFSPNPLNAT